jgi:hypothetical protein
VHLVRSPLLFGIRTQVHLIAWALIIRSAPHFDLELAIGAPHQIPVIVLIVGLFESLAESRGQTPT